MKTYKVLIRIPKYSDYETLLEIETTYKPSFIARVFGKRQKSYTEKFLGSCTVWYKIFENGLQRCNSSTEGWLCSVDKFEKLKSKNL